MDLINRQSEEHLVDLLSVIEKDPSAWVNVHITISRISEQVLEKESLSAQTLQNIQKSSMRVAQILVDSNLSGFEGTIFIFEDSDVMALFKKNAVPLLPILEKLRHEFTQAGLLTYLSISEMKDRLASLVEFSKAKRKSAAVFRNRRRAVEVADTILSIKTFSDPELTQRLQNNRAQRPMASALIIEDDMVARGMVTLALRDLCHVIQAKDAKSGIISYIDQAPNVVLLDIHLPDHNGHEVLNRLKFIDPEAYVVMLSGDSMPLNVISAKNLGVAGFIRKPFQKDNIIKYFNNCPTVPKYSP